MRLRDIANGREIIEAQWCSSWRALGQRARGKEREETEYRTNRPTGRQKPAHAGLLWDRIEAPRAARLKAPFGAQDAPSTFTIKRPAVIQLMRFAASKDGATSTTSRPTIRCLRARVRRNGAIWAKRRPPGTGAMTAGISVGSRPSASIVTYTADPDGTDSSAASKPSA